MVSVTLLAAELGAILDNAADSHKIYIFKAISFKGRIAGS